MVKFVQGNLLKANVDALVNAVNTVGVMGKGLALQFKKAFPDNFDAYAAACTRSEVRTGKMFVFETGLERPRFIINFPTKEHWRSPSKLQYIDDGLRHLAEVIRARKISSIAVPALGAGHGGLSWSDVRPRIETSLGKLSDVEVRVFEPLKTEDASKRASATWSRWEQRLRSALNRHGALSLRAFSATSKCDTFGALAAAVGEDFAPMQMMMELRREYLAADDATGFLAESLCKYLAEYARPTQTEEWAASAFGAWGGAIGSGNDAAFVAVSRDLRPKLLAGWLPASADDADLRRAITSQKWSLQQSRDRG
jgi:O-acetyl-ADP-ribose deacetylase (regulator of RNase III)